MSPQLAGIIEVSEGGVSQDVTTDNVSNETRPSFFDTVYSGFINFMNENPSNQMHGNLFADEERQPNLTLIELVSIEYIIVHLCDFLF